MIFIVAMRIIGIVFLLQAALVKAFFVQKSFLGHWQHQFKLLSFSKDVEDALSTLEVYNRDYLMRMKKGRDEGKTPQRIELERAQTLKGEGILKERTAIKQAVQNVMPVADEICLGIMALSGERAISVLKAWVSGLHLPRGILHAVDENDDSIEISTLNDIPVYLKYNSSDAGSAYMKAYKTSGFVGVIFQPKLSDCNFRQYGDLPLQIF